MLYNNLLFYYRDLLYLSEFSFCFVLGFVVCGARLSGWPPAGARSPVVSLSFLGYAEISRANGWGRFGSSYMPGLLFDTS